jgi:hypothetical protein
MNDKIRDPITTISRMISIVLKVFFFCIYFLISFIKFSAHPQFSTRAVIVQQVKMLGDPGVIPGYIWQVKSTSEKKHCMYFWLGGSALKL